MLRLLGALAALQMLSVSGAPEIRHVAVQIGTGGSGTRNSADCAPQAAKMIRADITAPVVTLPNLGKLNGSVSYSFKNQRPIYRYQGVPFAEAPVGEYRFKAPVPKAAWNGTLDGTSFGSVCIQTGTSSSATQRSKKASFEASEQSEDCLSLNVYTPQVDENASLPVLFFLHGGAFTHGSSRLITPGYVLDYDIVLVAANYRLGPFGFLNLQEEDVPGNAALLDQIAALQWVHDNIRYFGGDPNKVTLGGHSAGAASASLISLSPLTKGLFRSAMPMSGSSLGFWAWDRNPAPGSQRIATNLGCSSTDSAARVVCLQSASASALSYAFGMEALSQIVQGLSIGMSGTVPSVQTAGTIVLPDLPENILKSGNFTAVPLMTGVVKHEGTYALNLVMAGFIDINKLQDDEEFLRYGLVHATLELLGVDDPGDFVGDSVLGFYFDQDTLGDIKAMNDGLIDMLGALTFKSPVQQHALKHSQLGISTFLYSYVHNGVYTDGPLGITHGAEQVYLWPDGTDLENGDAKMSTILLDYVTNFVIYQNPTPANSSDNSNLTVWEEYKEMTEYYMSLDVTPTLLSGFRQELTVARRDNFNVETTVSPLTSSSSTTSSCSGNVCNSAAYPVLMAAASFGNLLALAIGITAIQLKAR